MAISGLESVGFIPDGNRRWARINRFSLKKAYRLGGSKMWSLVEWTLEYSSIRTLYIFLFSKDNFFKRDLLQQTVLKKVIESELAKALASSFFKENNVKLNFVGEVNVLGLKIYEMISHLEHKTRHNSGLKVIICIGYSGRSEIVDAAKKYAEDVMSEKNNGIYMNEKKFSKYLYNGVLSVDLIVRTGGEQRLSDFLLYQSAGANLVFLKKNLVDFGKEDFAAIVKSYLRNKRLVSDF